MTKSAQALYNEIHRMGSHKITLPAGTEPSTVEREVYGKWKLVAGRWTGVFTAKKVC